MSHLAIAHDAYSPAHARLTVTVARTWPHLPTDTTRPTARADVTTNETALPRRAPFRHAADDDAQRMR